MEVKLKEFKPSTHELCIRLVHLRPDNTQGIVALGSAFIRPASSPITGGSQVKVHTLMSDSVIVQRYVEGELVGDKEVWALEAQL